MVCLTRFIITSMPKAIHISTARTILNAGDPVDIVLFTSKGEIQHWSNAASFSYDVKMGCRKMRLLTSRQVRQLRDVCIISINNMEVFL